MIIPTRGATTRSYFITRCPSTMTCVFDGPVLLQLISIISIHVAWQFFDPLFMLSSSSPLPSPPVSMYIIGTEYPCDQNLPLYGGRRCLSSHFRNFTPAFASEQLNAASIYRRTNFCQGLPRELP